MTPPMLRLQRLTATKAFLVGANDALRSSFCSENGNRDRRSVQTFAEEVPAAAFRFFMTSSGGRRRLCQPRNRTQRRGLGADFLPGGTRRRVLLFHG